MSDYELQIDNFSELTAAFATLPVLTLGDFVTVSVGHTDYPFWSYACGITPQLAADDPIWAWAVQRQFAKIIEKHGHTREHCKLKLVVTLPSEKKRRR